MSIPVVRPDKAATKEDETKKQLIQMLDEGRRAFLTIMLGCQQVLENYNACDWGENTQALNELCTELLERMIMADIESPWEAADRSPLVTYASCRCCIKVFATEKREKYCANCSASLHT